MIRNAKTPKTPKTMSAITVQSIMVINPIAKLTDPLKFEVSTS